MKTIFENCDPRPEVLKGDLREDIFAASLTDVLAETADPVYQDPSVFFENTYPTSGLKELLAEALGRLTGAKPTGSPINRLETSFGGGKTHNLIALYHIARASIKASKIKGFVDSSMVPSKPIKKIVGIVGTDLEVAEGLDHGDVTTRTIWGEIAYQVGGKPGYKLMQKSDEQQLAPGTQLWEKLIGDEPALIMIDEVARYLRVAKGVVGKTSLAEQTVAFLMSLLKFASEKERVVVVLTLADSADAFGVESDELRQELSEIKSLSSRMEHIITPTAETELSAIVTHRLFKKIDRKAAQDTVASFCRYYEEQVEHDVDLPSRSTRSEYGQEMVDDYPFHPEFLTTLNRKISTIPNFQRTRGALRLLAMTVRQLWQTKPLDAYLIHPHHLEGVRKVSYSLPQPSAHQVDHRQ